MDSGPALACDPGSAGSQAPLMDGWSRSAVAENQGYVRHGADGPLVSGTGHRGGGKQRAEAAVGRVGVLGPGAAVPAQDQALHHSAVDAGQVVPDGVDVTGS